MAVNNGDLIKVVQTIGCPSNVIAQNVYYWLMSDPAPDNPSNAQVVAAVDTRLDDMYSQLDAEMSDRYEATTFTVERIDWSVDHWETLENIGTGDIAVQGEDVGGVGMPHGNAAVVTCTTSRPQTRARKFLPGFNETLVDDSELGAAILAVLATYASSWLSAQVVVGAAELIPAVASQSGPTAGTIMMLATAVVNSIVGYQRRRKPGVGI